MLNETNPQLHAADPKDFKKIYDATMQLLFKISYRVVNDEEAAEGLQGSYDHRRGPFRRRGPQQRV